MTSFDQPFVDFERNRILNRKNLDKHNDKGEAKSCRQKSTQQRFTKHPEPASNGSNEKEKIGPRPVPEIRVRFVSKVTIPLAVTINLLVVTRLKESEGQPINLSSFINV